MFRLIFLMALMPSFAAADWAPRPSMFDYGATFDVCKTDPNVPDLAAHCAPLIEATYVLKRAVARGAFNCGTRDLKTCALEFEDEGLPHIAVRIAVDAGCEATPFGIDDHFFAENHCVSVASDIMVDEGVVPLFGDIDCTPQWAVWSECSDLVLIQAQLWEDEILTLSQDDPLVFDLLERIGAECGETIDTPDFPAGYVQGVSCFSENSARLWADLVQGDN